MNITAFLSTSPLAKKIKLPGRVVIHRDSLSPRDIISIKEKNTYEYEAQKPETCELEVNGEVIARGKIVKKSNRFFFKVLEMNPAALNGGKEESE